MSEHKLPDFQGWPPGHPILYLKRPHGSGAVQRIEATYLETTMDREGRQKVRLEVPRTDGHGRVSIHVRPNTVTERPRRTP